MLNRPYGLHMREQLSLYVFVAVLFVIGVTFGAVMVNALTQEQQEQLGRHLGHFFVTLDAGSAGSFWQMFALHVKWLAVIWILGLSVVGLPLVFALDFLKGVLVGFTVGFLVSQYSWKGMLFSLVAVVPQNLVVLPALVIGSVMAIAFSLYLIKNRFIQRKGAVGEPLLRYTLTMAGLAALMAGVSLYEASLSPHVMKWVTPMLTGQA